MWTIKSCYRNRHCGFGSIPAVWVHVALGFGISDRLGCDVGGLGYRPYGFFYGVPFWNPRHRLEVRPLTFVGAV